MHFFQDFWDSSVFRYFVDVNCLPVIVVEVWVDRSLLCITLGGLCKTWSWLSCWSVCVVSSIWLLLSVCLYLSVYFSVTNGFVPFRLPLADALSVPFPGGRREVFLLWGLAGNFSNCCNGFLGQIQISLTDIALALTCKSQVNVFLSTPACFRSPTNSTGKFIVELLVEFCSLLRCSNDWEWWFFILNDTCRSTRTHYPDSETTNLCSFSLIQRA